MVCIPNPQLPPRDDHIPASPQSGAMASAEDGWTEQLLHALHMLSSVMVTASEMTVSAWLARPGHNSRHPCRGAEYIVRGVTPQLPSVKVEVVFADSADDTLEAPAVVYLDSDHHAQYDGAPPAPVLCFAVCDIGGWFRRQVEKAFDRALIARTPAIQMLFVAERGGIGRHSLNRLNSPIVPRCYALDEVVISPSINLGSSPE